MRDLPAYVEHFRARVVQDALAEATAAYWQRRARAFAAVGNERCDQIAVACHNHARFLAANPPIPQAEIIAALRESA